MPCRVKQFIFVIRRVRRQLIVGQNYRVSLSFGKLPGQPNVINFGRILPVVVFEKYRQMVDGGKLLHFHWQLDDVVVVARQHPLLLGFFLRHVKCHMRNIFVQLHGSRVEIIFATQDGNRLELDVSGEGDVYEELFVTITLYIPNKKN